MRAKQQYQSSLIPQKVKRKPSRVKWLLSATGEAILVIICVSLVYATFLLVDWLVQTILTLTLSDLIMKYAFVANAFDGFKIFSAVAIVLLYLFHLLLTVFDQVRFMLSVSGRSQKEEEEEEEKDE